MLRTAGPARDATIDPAASSRGFALAEVAVALFLSVTAAVGVVRLLDVSARTNHEARLRTTATVLAVQKIEQLRSLAWARGPSGEAITDRRTNLSVDPPTDDGPGLGAAPDAALDLNLPPYVDYLDSSGAWLGTGPTPSVGAAYVRRWSISPLPSRPDETLVLVVVVVPLEREVRRAPGSRGRLADEARMVVVKSRKLS
jgi:hypothetical protein